MITAKAEYLLVGNCFFCWENSVVTFHFAVIRLWQQSSRSPLLYPLPVSFSNPTRLYIFWCISRCTDISFFWGLLLLLLLLCFYRCERGSRAGNQAEAERGNMFVFWVESGRLFPWFPVELSFRSVWFAPNCLLPVPVAIQKRSLFAFVIITNRISLPVCLSVSLPPTICISFCACSCPILCVFVYELVESSKVCPVLG